MPHGRAWLRYGLLGDSTPRRPCFSCCGEDFVEYWLRYSLGDLNIVNETRCEACLKRRVDALSLNFAAVIVHVKTHRGFV